MRVARFRVAGRLEYGSRDQVATVTIEHDGGTRGLVTVRPLRCRRTYTATLADVAHDLVMTRMREVAAERRAGARRKARR